MSHQHVFSCVSIFTCHLSERNGFKKAKRLDFSIVPRSCVFFFKGWMIKTLCTTQEKSAALPNCCLCLAAWE